MPRPAEQVEPGHPTIKTQHLTHRTCHIAGT
jgi:hypothetical protein